MRDFSPFVTLAELKSQPGVAIKVMQKQSCDYVIKVSARPGGLKSQPAFNKRPGIFISAKRAEKFHVIASQNI